jgi:hypothetical protein
MDIVLTTNDTCTLTDIIIDNLTHANLVSRDISSKGIMATMIIVQAKVVSYHNQHLEDDFIPLAIEIFGCLHN